MSSPNAAFASRRAASSASSSSAGCAHDAHPASAAAGGGLDDQRETDLVRLARRDDRDAGLARDPLRLELVPAGAERLRRGPDEDQAGRLDRFREVGVLGQEAVAGMDRVGARLLRRANVLLGVEVAPHLDRLVGRRGRAASPRSSGATTATVAIPSSRQARKTRSAISPRLATSSFWMVTARRRESASGRRARP